MQKIDEHFRDTIRLMDIIGGEVAALGENARVTADDLHDPDNVKPEAKVALLTHGAELIASMEKTAAAMASASIELKRAANAIWASMGKMKPAENGGQHVV